MTEPMSRSQERRIAAQREEVTPERLAERIQLALDLAVNYDGMTEPDSLRSLIDDMVKALKGEMEIIDIAAHRQEGEE